MKRRTLLAGVMASAFVPASAFAAAGFIDYAPGVIEKALADGKTVFVDYSADWCGTCKRQERVINALRAEDPAFDAAMIFVRVDWDQYKNHDVTVLRSIPRRSTLIVLKGGDEVGRLVAGTGQSEIKGLMALGL